MRCDPHYRPAADLLKDRVILITGAADGLGRATAKACARHGATLILLGRTIRKLEKIYDEICAAGGPDPAIYPMNLEGAAPKDYADLAATLESEFGRLDGLVHNAAELGTPSPLDASNIETWYKVLQVNLHAPFLLTHACLPLLRKSADASVVFVGDAVGRKAKAYWGAYAVSKFGLEGLMQVLADETENSGILRSNSFDPGILNTALRRRGYPAENYTANPTPDSAVPGLLYLLGPDSRGVTGQSCVWSPAVD